MDTSVARFNVEQIRTTLAAEQDEDRREILALLLAEKLRRQHGSKDARVSKREVLIRRGDRWLRYIEELSQLASLPR